MTSFDVNDHLAGVGSSFEGLCEGGHVTHGLALALVPAGIRTSQMVDVRGDAASDCTEGVKRYII